MSGPTDQGISVAEIRASLQDFLTARAPLSALRHVVDGEDAASSTGYDPAVWTELATGLQVTAIAVPTAFGGLGLGHAAHVAVLEECGAVLYSGPVRSNAVAAQALLAAGPTEQTGEWVAAIAAGTLSATVATPASGPRAVPSLAARLSADGATATGTARFVPDGGVADLVLATATSDAGDCLVAIDLSAGVEKHPAATIDMTHRFADLTFADAPATVLTAPGDTAVLDRIDDLAALALAAEQIGGARACLRLAAEYAGIRTQFDRPIGSYQAIAHRLAELAIDVEAARALIQRAARLADADDTPAFARLVPLARARASQVFSGATDTVIQVHGGTGFTWEHDAHLYFRRARATAAWFGTPRRWFELFAQRRDPLTMTA